MLGGKIKLVMTTLAPEESLTVTVPYTVTQEDMDSDEIINIATVEGTPPGYDPEDPNSPQKPTDEDDEEVPVEHQPAIELTKTADVEVYTEAGQKVTYTFVITNTGNVTLTDVELNDPMLGGNIELEVTTLAPGQSTVVKVEYTVTQEDLDRGSILNVATVEGTPPGYNPEDPNSPQKPTDEDDNLLPGKQNPSIKLEKSGNVELVSKAGEVVTYTFVITNTGNVTLTDVVLNDPMLGGNIELEITTLAPGESTSGKADYVVTEADLANKEIHNIATVEGTPPGYDPEDPNSPQKPTDTDDYKVYTEAKPSISLEKSNNAKEVTHAGQKIKYTFVITNTGNVTLTEIVLNDDMLGGVIKLTNTTLKPGESMTVEKEYTVTAEDLKNKEHVNVATVEGTPPGYDPKNPNSPQPPTDKDTNIIPVKPDKSKLPPTGQDRSIGLGIPIGLIALGAILLVSKKKEEE